jgi:L-2-hydroxyglutarate oxidase LhgO
VSASTDVVVIGAGVVGLAIAREFALAGREVIVLESNARIGEGISARSSEIVHAGIYYPTRSLKAELCTLGRDLLYAYCERKGVPYRRCGKLIVATGTDQRDRLGALEAQALANGVDDIECWPAEKVRQHEPQLRCAAALWSPATGIVDSHALMIAMQGDIEAAGGAVAVLSVFAGARPQADGILIDVRAGTETSSLKTGTLINSAGLNASAVARSVDGLAREHVPETRLAKGHYFVLQGKNPFRHLVYPLPEPGGLGVHVTLDLDGRARFGPDVEWVDSVDYRVDASRAGAFHTSIRSYWPAIPNDALVPGYAGIRPKIAGPGDPPADFLISAPRMHGVPGLVNLFGIESPGLTAALAIARHVRALLNDA